MQNWKAALLPRFLIFSLFFFVGTSLGKAADSFTVAPPPAWVKILTLAPAANPATNGDNLKYVLLDGQVNVSTAEHYHRVVEEPLSADGIQDCVQISIDFDPTYQHLVIHNICIRRGTNVFNLLQPDKIKVIQQEKDLDMNIYNGEVSAVLFLEDVQVGDEIDYSYTITGFNPIFAGHYLDDFYLQWGDPVEDEQFRLLWPANRYLGIKNHGSDIQPVVTKTGDTKEYLWQLHNVPSVTEEDSLPSWYDLYPWVQLSEFASWEDVATWALRLYPSPKQLDPQLQAKISKWEQASAQPEARVAAALAFVQDEIRYMGIEVGPNSHQPNDPSLVFERRFGDCKDKAYLFCTILHAMGIDASEALVDTGNLKTIADWLPSPYAFDHVVTQVRLNGKTYWLDPTQVHQGGAFDQHFFTDYGYCLLIRLDSKALTAIPQQHTGWPRTTVTETFIVHGRKEPAEFTVRTVAEGSDADQLRASITGKRRDELEKNYLNFYAREYPKIESTRPLEVIDRPGQNLFETIEHYRIKEFWTLSDDKQNYECDFYPQVIRDLFDEPNTTLRSLPLDITYPCHEILQTDVILPEDWPIKDQTDHFQSIATQLDFKRDVGQDRFSMRYEYQTLTNFVSTNEMPAYARTLNRMKDALGYSLTWENMDVASNNASNTSHKGGVNWAIIALGGIYVLLLLILAIVVHQYGRGIPPVLPDESIREFSGLRGWLILAAIGIFISPLCISYSLVSNAHVYSPDRWHALTDPSGAAYDNLWAPLLIYEFLVNLTLVIFAIFLLVLFFERRRIFPKLFVTWVIFAAVTATIDHFVPQLIPAVASKSHNYDPTLGQDYFGCLIWIPYMLLSRRVKATFIRN